MQYFFPPVSHFFPSPCPLRIFRPQINLVFLLLNTLLHTEFQTAARNAGLPQMYSAGVLSALNRAMIAKRFVASFLNLSPFLVTYFTEMFTKDGAHKMRKQMTTKTIMRSDSFLLSLSLPGASRLSWYFVIMYSLMVIKTLTATITCRTMTPKAFIWAANATGTTLWMVRIEYVKIQQSAQTPITTPRVMYRL